ncbi:MAG TPA: cytochrome c oxidase assembly factor Coa1 family protein [Pyrinomonadaceae bacterium]|nr:cytochrome c oxidase assembly factor Coa1 family protein [Pyrinomonadaceae bacterium]
MTTKKIVLILAGVVVTIGLLVCIFVAGIVGFVLYQIGNSEAAATAKEFLRNNELLRQDIGEVKDFGSIITGSVNVVNNDGTATLSLKVIGERRTINATVDLTYRSGRPWRVTGATYKNQAGELVDLLAAYDARKLIPQLLA